MPLVLHEEQKPEKTRFHIHYDFSKMITVPLQKGIE